MLMNKSSMLQNDMHSLTHFGNPELCQECMDMETWMWYTHISQK